MDLSISGRVAIVTAATAGLGRAAAAALAAEGARVMVSGHRQSELDDVATALPGVATVLADAADADTPRRIVEQTTQMLGAPDIVVLNGPGPAPGTAAELSPELTRAAIESLLIGHQQIIELVLPGMCERGWGRILGFGSSGVVAPIANLVASNVGRAAFAAYLKTLASEVAPRGVTVNMLAPGRIATDRVAQLDQAKAQRQGLSVAEISRASQSAIPTGRYGSPDEFAAAAAFLCSAPASYITGSLVRCDGGLIPTL